MKVTALVENISDSPSLPSQDGLSIHIKTEKHKILFDMGADSLFIKNAEELGIDLSEIDIAVISHGHFDHGGGLKDFLTVNADAKIYMSRKAFGDYYTIDDNRYVYAGLEKSLLDTDRIVFVSGDFRISEEIKLYSDIDTCEIMKVQNKNLLEEIKGQFVDDTFSHEQNIVINDGESSVLITGCAHKGIINIINHITQKEKTPDYVIGGFHLKNIDNSDIVKQDIAKCLEKLESKYYTCHCTGFKHYKILKDMLGDRINYLSTGCEIII